MVSRVVLGALPGGGRGLRVSRPGFNVMDTGLSGKQLAFDSRWTSAARVFLNGTITLGVVTPISYFTLPFGTVFPVSPPVIVLQRPVSSASWQVVDGVVYNTGAEPVRVHTDRMEIMYPFTGGSRQFCYLVLRPF